MILLRFLRPKRYTLSSLVDDGEGDSSKSMVSFHREREILCHQDGELK